MDWGALFSNAAYEMFSPSTAAYALAAIGLAIHLGFTGLLNFGQAGFMAVGAYGFAISTLTFGFPWWAAMLFGIAASVLLALLLGIPTLRLRADYLAIVTLAAAEIVRLLFTTNTFASVTGSAAGLSGYKTSFQAMNLIPKGRYHFGPWRFNEYDLWLIIISWSLVALACLLVWLLMRSPWGRVIRGIREDEDAVRALGKNVYLYKMQSLILGGALGAFAGMVYILPRSVQPGNFQPTLTFFIYAILLLGGAATIVGPVIGSMIFWVLLSFFSGFVARAAEAGWLPFVTSLQSGQVRFILVGVALMTIVIFRPQGIMGSKKELAFVKQ